MATLQNNFKLAVLLILCGIAGIVWASPVRDDLAAKSIDYADTTVPLPYGAIPVEYIESTGTQYIGVGSIIGATAVEAIVSTSVEAPDSGGYKVFGIGYWVNMCDDFGMDIRGWGGSLRPVVVDTYISVRYDTTGRFVNNKQIGGPAQTARFFSGANAGQKLFLFCGSNGSKAYITGSGNYMAWRGRISLFEVFAEQISTVKLQPVRFPNEMGEWEGALLDLVSGDLYRNQGNGSFLIGPDI